MPRVRLFLPLVLGFSLWFALLGRADDCEPFGEEGASGVFTIYDAQTGAVRGWSHIVSSPERFPLIAQERSRYAVDGSSLEADEECEERQVFRTILVKKMSNWGQQHANGIEPVFFDTPLRVGSVESVTVWVKFHSDESTVPDAKQLAGHYGPYLSGEQIAGLDRGVACLSFCFMEAGYNDQGSESLKAEYYAEFDPATDFDRWLKVEVPLREFRFGYEKSYAFRSIDREEALEHSFVGFRINPETTGGIVSRNFLNEGWDDSVPELYKEMSISLARIEAKVDLTAR